MVPFVRGESSALREAFAAQIAFVTLAQVRGSHMRVQPAFPGEFLAAGGAGEPSRAVRRFQVLLEGAFLCKVALAERTRLALDDAFVDAPEVLVEAPPLKVGGVAKRTREASVKVERGLVVVERRKGSVRFPAYIAGVRPLRSIFVNHPLMSPQVLFVRIAFAANFAVQFHVGMNDVSVSLRLVPVFEQFSTNIARDILFTVDDSLMSF